MKSDFTTSRVNPEVRAGPWLVTQHGVWVLRVILGELRWNPADYASKGRFLKNPAQEVLEEFIWAKLKTIAGKQNLQRDWENAPGNGGLQLILHIRINRGDLRSDFWNPMVIDWAVGGGEQSRQSLGLAKKVKIEKHFFYTGRYWRENNIHSTQWQSAGYKITMRASVVSCSGAGEALRGLEKAITATFPRYVILGARRQ